MNIGYAKINKTDEYVDLEATMGITLTEGTTYQVQIQGAAVICESDEQPTTGGFYCKSLKPFAWVKKGKVWIKVQSAVANVNIGD